MQHLTLSPQRFDPVPHLTTPLQQLPPWGAAAVFSALVFIAGPAQAASCCGGGSSGSLILPKFSTAMVDVSLDYEHYDGFWNSAGVRRPDPAGSDLNQYRVNAGFAYRLAPRWQGSVSVPYVWNQNQYSNSTRNTHGLGDSSISLWYEAFDKVACVWEVNSLEDWLPAVYWGGTLTVPTGTSPYDDVVDNFDITGRGAYRLDASVLVDKTIYPWNATFSANYGKYLQRSVNHEDGKYIEPYKTQLGDRLNSSLAFGYTYFTDEMQSLTGTLAYAYLEEDDGTDTPGFRKRSFAATLAWASEDRDWVGKISWSHSPRNDNWGRNFPSTDVLTVGVSHVLR